MTEQPNEAEVHVFDGDIALETRRCHIYRLHDGRTAALWRGLMFPILPGNRIDASGDARPIADALPLAAFSKAFAIIDGQSEAYVLVPGNFVEVQTIAVKLRQAGISVLRTGRYFGERIAEVDAEWFIRIAKPLGDEKLTSVLEPLLGTRAARPAEAVTAEPRARLLTAELLAARSREVGLQVEIARLRSEVAEGKPEAERRAVALREALEEEQRRREAAEHAAAVLERRPLPTSSGRIAEEVRDVLAGLLPNVRMLRDSVEVITAEFVSRQGVWRAFGELTAAGTIPRDWKKIHGAEGWWERHLINGRDNGGRIYVRKATGAGW